MKKIVCNILFATSISLLACGCDNAPDSVELSGGDNTLTITLAKGRTSLGELVDGYRSVYWSEGDCIAANGESSAAADIDATNRSKAKFSFAGELSYPCDLLYPATFYKDATTITLPLVQEAATSTFATNTSPMAACVDSSGEAVQLHHLTGVVHLQVKAYSGENPDLHPMYKVEFKGNNAEQISGDFAIDYQSATLTPLSTAKGDRKCVVRVEGALSTTEVKHIFIVVPAQEYAKGFTIRLVDEQGHFMDKSKGSAVTIGKGEVLTMPIFEFEVMGTTLDVGI